MPSEWHLVNGTGIAINQEWSTKVTLVVDSGYLWPEETLLCLGLGPAHRISELFGFWLFYVQPLLDHQEPVWAVGSFSWHFVLEGLQVLWEDCLTEPDSRLAWLELCFRERSWRVRKRGDLLRNKDLMWRCQQIKVESSWNIKLGTI